MSADRQFVEALLGALEPYLGAEARRAGQALRGLLALFPGQGLGEVEKAVRKLLAGARTSVPALAERGRGFGTGSPGEPVESWMKDVAGLGAADLKQLGKVLGLDLKGPKAVCLEILERWARSGGRERPLDAKEQARADAARYAGSLPERMRALDAATADEVIRASEAASRGLTAEGFRTFAGILGIPVSGPKPKMLQQVKDFVNRAAVSNQQTKF